MAITFSKERSGRTHTIDAMDGFKRTYQRRWFVVSDTATENPVLVRMAPTIPLLGTGHPNDVRALLVRKAVENITGGENERKVWVVTCFYETLKREQKKRFTHPLDRPYEIEWRGETFTTIAEKDKDGDGILNSAGQYFDPPIEVDNVRPVLTITRNEEDFDGELAADYQEAINTDDFFGGAPFTVKCKAISATRVIEEFGVEGSEAEVVFWRVTYEFHYWHRTWLLKPLDQGRYELEGNELVKITDDAGDHVTDPVPLDGAGQKLSPSSLPDSAVFLEYHYYREKAFAAFNF